MNVKIHKLSFAGEDNGFNGGNRICIAQLGTIIICLTICYDLSFQSYIAGSAKIVS